MKRSLLAFALALAATPGICTAQEEDKRIAGPGLGRVPTLKCCECVNGKTMNPPPLDVSTGVVPWKVDGGPAHVTTAHPSWVKLPPAQWIQKPAAGNPKPAGPGPFDYTTTFNVPSCAKAFTAVVVSGTFSADNGGDIWLDSQPPVSCPGVTCFAAGKPFSFSTTPGTHTLHVRVTNQPSSVSGLIVNAKVNGRCPVCEPPPKCTTTVDVSGMHYPNQTCAQTQAAFQAGALTSFHFTSKCQPPSKLTAVFNISCQDAPIPGFPTGSVYKGTACCTVPEVVIPGLNMQGGNEKTPCPSLNVVIQRAQAPSVPYLQIMLPNLDQRCATQGAGLKLVSIKFTKCAPDPRGVGFGPNATADLTCG